MQRRSPAARKPTQVQSKGALRQPNEVQVQQQNPMEAGRAQGWCSLGAPQPTTVQWTTRSPPGALRAAGWG